MDRIAPPGGLVIEEEKEDILVLPPNKVAPSQHRYAYTKQHHFREALRQLQATEKAPIPLIILKEIQDELRKKRIQVPTEMDIRDILRANGLYSQYHHAVPAIWSHLTGRKPPKLTEAQERACYKYFDDMMQAHQEEEEKSGRKTNLPPFRRMAQELIQRVTAPQQ